MSVLGCGAEVSKLMDVSDKDYVRIERGISNWLKKGVSQSKAQLKAVDEALAQLAEERTMVMRAIDEQLGKAPANEPVAEPADEPVFANREQTDTPSKPNDVSPIGFYSALARGIDAMKTAAAPAAGWKDAIKGMVNKGAAKADEVEWSGINDWLDMQKGKVTKEQVADFLKNNGVQVQETVLGARVGFNESRYDELIRKSHASDLTQDEVRELNALEDARFNTRTDKGATATKYGSYVVPGGENYREVLLTLPTRGITDSDIQGWYSLTYGDTIENEAGPDWRNRRDEFIAEMQSGEREQGDGVSYRSSHWDQKNVLAHIRLNDRTDADGKRVLFVEEVQSDWGQQAKKDGIKGATPTDDQVREYFGLKDGADPADYRQEMMDTNRKVVPNAPFIKNTEGWLNLALKRIIKMAVDEGYDKIAFANGEQNAAHYDLSKKISRVKYTDNRNPEHPGQLVAYDHDGNVTIDNSNVPQSKLPDIIGKELADKLLQAESKSERDFANRPMRVRELSGLDLKVGGEGMREFYDKIVPIAVGKLSQKLGGGKMETVNFPAGKPSIERAGRSYYEVPSKVKAMEQPGFTITDAMREKVGDGVPLFANKAQSKWRDEAGRWQLAPGQMLWEMMGKASGPLLDRLYLRSASPEVRHVIRKMKLDQQKAMDTTHELVGAMREMSAEERSMISDIIEKEVKAGVTPPASAVQHAAMMNEAFEKQTDELVRLGMLTQEAADRWRGKYLPRYYKSKLAGASIKDTWADFISGLQMGNRGDALKGIRGKHLRGRGITQSIDASELDDYKAKGWEVRDPDFDPATDSTVYVWRDYTKEEREKMGEIRDAGFRFTLGYMQTQKDIALGRMYESIANNPDMSSRTQPDDTYVQVPDTNVPETGAKRYGKLAGRWVTRNMMSQLSLQQEMESDAIRLYRKALSIWKENKTVLNPVSHMNNFVSNLTMAHFAGVSYWDAGKYAGAIKDFASGKGLLKEAREAGLFLGSMSEEELGKMLPIELQSLVNVQDSKTVTGMKLAHTVLTWGLRRPAGIAYEFGDRFFKYLIYKDARAQGMEPEAAVDYAQKYIFTYDGLPRGARAVRDLAIPFFSYTYKAIPTLAETALTHPHRMIAPATLLSVASMAAYAIAAGGDDDWMESVEKYLKDAEFRKKADTMQEEEYKLLPEWMKGHTALGSQKTLRLGTDKLTGNPVFLDTSRFIPGGDLFDVTGNSGGVPWLQPLTPSNPLLSMYTAMIANKDVFTGKELVNKDLDTAGEAFDKRADWLWKMAMPAIAINQAHWDRAVNAVAQARGNRELPIPDIIGGNLTGIGKDGMPVQAKYAAMNTVGIKARPLDLEMSEQIQASQKRKTLRDLEAQLRQARMLNAKGAMSDREFDRRVETIHMKQERIEEGLTVDGNARK